MRISDWSSDVCSSDLDYTIQSGFAQGLGFGAGVRYVGESYGNDQNTFKNDDRFFLDGAVHYDLGALSPSLTGAQIGRASCRERLWQYGLIRVGAVALQQKQNTRQCNHMYTTQS